MNDALNDILLSLLTGVALFVAAHGVHALCVDHLPAALLIDGANPLARLAIARLLLFIAIVAVLALPVCYPLAWHASRPALAITLPGAAAAMLLLLLMARIGPFDPFPAWLDVARGAALFVALPLATNFWWRRSRRHA